MAWPFFSTNELTDVSQQFIHPWVLISAKILITSEGVFFAVVDCVAFVLIYKETNLNNVFLFGCMQNNTILIGAV